MTNIVSIVNLKGGTGKTTLSAILGVSLAMQNKKVCLIDFDPQAHLTSVFFKATPNKNVYHLLQNRKFPYSKPELIENNKVRENLKIIPSSVNFFADVFLRRFGAGLLGPETLRQYFRQERSLDKFDYVIIDCPPDPIFARYGLEVSNYIIVPTDLGDLNVNGTIFFVNKILYAYYALIDERKDKPKLIGIVLNNVNSRVTTGLKKVKNYLEHKIKEKFKDTPLRELLYEELLFNTVVYSISDLRRISLYATKKRKSPIERILRKNEKAQKFFESLTNEFELRIQRFRGMSL